MSSVQPFSLRARWVLPIAGPPIDGGHVAIVGERIESVGHARPDGPVEDLGDVAILPGFVNAHTHLEFSDLAEPLGQPGLPFADWIRAVVAWRRARSDRADAAIARGLAECVASGTTSVGEIATSDWPAPGDSATDVTVFRELLAFGQAGVERQIATARDHLAAKWTERSRPGLSPHAPYSVHPHLFDAAIGLACRENVPVAMHLAETREELKFLATLGGPLRTLLEDFGAWSPATLAAGGRPLDYLRRLAAAPRALVVHGNYLEADEETFLAERRATMSVVYCPRTHAYFGHEPYPLARRLASGVRMALGTDSRASNPDLSLLAEVKFAAARHPDVAPRELLDVATRGGALALRLDHEVGTLEPGKLVDLAVVHLPGGTNEPHEQLLAQESTVVQTWCRGSVRSLGNAYLPVTE